MRISMQRGETPNFSRSASFGEPWRGIGRNPAPGKKSDSPGRIFACREKTSGDRIIDRLDHCATPAVPPPFEFRRWSARCLASLASRIAYGCARCSSQPSSRRPLSASYYASFVSDSASTRSPDRRRPVPPRRVFAAPSSRSSGAMNRPLLCRYYDVDASLPFSAGTVRADWHARRLHSHQRAHPKQRMLFDIGIAGPLPGFSPRCPRHREAAVIFSERRRWIRTANRCASSSRRAHLGTGFPTVTLTCTRSFGAWFGLLAGA
jgi:hypothetical protein